MTDKDLNVNAHFIGQDGLATGFDGTWISALGIKWNEGARIRTLTVEVKQVRTSDRRKGSLCANEGHEQWWKLAEEAAFRGRALLDEPFSPENRDVSLVDHCGESWLV